LFNGAWFSAALVSFLLYAWLMRDERQRLARTAR
jgi:hypothetical protein